MAKSQGRRRSARYESPVPPEARGYRVFISHATADKWIARALCEKIEAVGAATFRDDRDIHGGDDIPAAVRAEILRADEFLVLLTLKSAERQWVLIEIGAAWGGAKRIIPVVYDLSVDSIPAVLRSTKAIQLNDLDELAGRLKTRQP